MKPKGLWVSVWYLLLLASFGGVYFALAAVIMRPSATQAKSEPFLFPAQIPLSGWQSIDTEPIVSSDVPQQGQQYRYLQNERTMIVDLWYGRNGRACQQLLRRKLTPSEVPASSSQGSGDGVNEEQADSAKTQNAAGYASSVHETAHGSYKHISGIGEDSIQAVIDARGGSVVTQEQFIRNRYQYFLRPRSMLRWLTGRESITGDHDCLLTELSIPTQSTSAVSTRSLLESTWQDIFQWGQAQLYVRH
ncbi:hypothetical protein S7335_2619 [Synechococcus sp. PCC 7335]|uniref:cyanoexosortase A system-associated protein n=1 Tax=Synechococcus sp. (strain ATCC 29403 / PCC 7335) TaxID=91464 RepID=UPI00017EB7DD|nr:cyanoexosortase A system-associated protein [Synechococcus sp. PCC 7335]EDX84920.1 hypothetical protein S7335_2619 [Synechococcus sp. PCC 7335]